MLDTVVAYRPSKLTNLFIYINVSWVQYSIRVANREQYTIVAWFRVKQWEIFKLQEKKRPRVVLFFKTAISRQQKDCKYRMLVKCNRGLLIWTGLTNSDVWTVCILQQGRLSPWVVKANPPAMVHVHDTCIIPITSRCAGCEEMIKSPNIIIAGAKSPRIEEGEGES